MPTDIPRDSGGDYGLRRDKPIGSDAAVKMHLDTARGMPPFNPQLNHPRGCSVSDSPPLLQLVALTRPQARHVLIEVLLAPQTRRACRSYADWRLSGHDSVIADQYAQFELPADRKRPQTIGRNPFNEWPNQVHR